MRTINNKGTARYVLAVLAAAAALLLRELLNPLLGPHNLYHTAWLAVGFSAWYCGLGPALVALGVEVLGVWYWFLPPSHSWRVQDRSDIYGMFGFIILGGIFAAVCDTSRRTAARKAAAEEQAQHARRLFETFMDNSPSTVYLKDEEGRYLYTNASNRTRFANDFVGKTDFDIFPSSMAVQLREHDLAVLTENKPKEFIETTQEPDGEHTWLSVKFPVSHMNGKKLIGGKSLDITDRKRAEDALRQARDELETRVRERTREAAAAESRLRSLLESAPDAMIVADHKAKSRS